MAQVTKTKSGKFKFVVTINYKQSSGTFDTKAEGYAWEDDLKAGNGSMASITLAKLLTKYRDEITPKKEGHRWETIRINRFINDKEFSEVKLDKLTTKHFSDWKFKRLDEVSNLTVLREIATLSPIFNFAIKEWKYLKVNPLDDMSKPKKPPARDRLISQDEIDRLCHAMTYSPDAPIKLITTRVCAGFLFAIETALRDKEICQLKWIDVKNNMLKVKDSKTASGIRDVPMSPRALEIIEQCKGIDKSLVFGIKTSQRDSLFRKAKTMAGITKDDNLHFHDTRHEAITRLAKKLNVLELARVVGHKNLNELLTYYNETAENIAKKLQ